MGLPVEGITMARTDPKKEPIFAKVVQKFLNTPPKPHKFSRKKRKSLRHGVTAAAKRKTV
jgi:hypothetical protein